MYRFLFLITFIDACELMHLNPFMRVGGGKYHAEIHL